MNVSELYPIVKPTIIVGICGQTELVTSFIEHAIYFQYDTNIFWNLKGNLACCCMNGRWALETYMINFCSIFEAQ